MSGQSNDPYNRPPVEGKFNMENADRYDDPAVDPRASGPGSGLGVQEGDRAARTDAKIAQNAARGLQSDSAQSQAASATGTAGTAAGSGQGYTSSGLSSGQSTQQGQGQQGQYSQGQQGQQRQGGVGGVGGASSGNNANNEQLVAEGQPFDSSRGQTGAGGRDPYDRPPVEGQFNMNNADRYDDPSVDPRATGPGSGFGLSEGQQARQTDARMAGQGQQR